MPKTDDLVIEAEDIVKRIRNGNLVLLPKARTIFITKTLGRDALGRVVKEEYSLADVIGEEVSNFLKAKSIRCTKSEVPFLQDYEITILRSKKDLRLHDISCKLIEYIEQARTNGVVEDRNLTEKLEEYEEKNLRLEEENDKLQKECQRLKELNEALHKSLDRFGDRTSNVEKNDKPNGK